MLKLQLKYNFKDLIECFGDDNSCLNQFLILENYLNQSVKLRLNVEECHESLKEAHVLSTIITSKISNIFFRFSFNFRRNY